MSFSYDKSKSRSEHGTDSMWASYSDLLTMVSFVFLMLFVVANLRSSAASLQNRVEYQRLAMETDDLKQQNKVYDALNEDYLTKDASKNEVQVYKDLMDKLSLLRDKAKEEKEDLRRQAEANEEKELALNHYQQIIRNIVNANVVAKAKLISRDEVIDRKRDQIAAQEQEIAQNNEEIRAIRDNLQDRVAQLQKSEKARKISKAKMEKEVARLRALSDAKIAELNAQNDAAEQQLDAVAEELQKTQGDLKQTTGKLAMTEGKLQEESVARARLAGELEAAKAGFEDQMDQLKGEYEAKAAGDRAAFEKELAGAKLSGDERAAKEKAFADKLAGDKAALEGKLKGLGDQIADTEKQLAAAEAGRAEAEAGRKQAEDEKGRYKDYVAALEKQKGDLADDLAQAKAQLNDRKKVADTIRNELKKAGIAADVDAKTGEVTIAFGKEYFDTGKADLKPGMEQKLRKFVPLYTKSLFKDPKIAKKIGSIDLVGFASPTYKGKYVDPASLDEADRDAVSYNLDLSYQRARSIFGYIFDTDKMKFADQQRLLGMVKVSGRSFLHEAVKGRDVASGISVKEFCAKFDCLQEQKVIIKFNMKD
jgi:outer membrane protein OmpA-like peptidoglycan-associated protein